MPTVNATAELTGARIEGVWDVVSDAGHFPDLADHVLEVSPGDGGHRWVVLLNGSRVQWVQRDRPRGPRLLEFEQVEGDLDALGGRWTLDPSATGVTLGLRIEFHLGVDGLAHLLDPIWTQSFQAHADALTRAVAAADPVRR
jgi:polyketide cyclase/dehydrase/lipid transport protein